MAAWISSLLKDTFAPDTAQTTDAMGRALSTLSGHQLTMEHLAADSFILPDEDISLIAHRMAFSAPVHTHSYYEFLYLLKGDVVNVVAGEELYMPEGSLCLMNLESSHALEAINTEAIVVNLCLRPELFSSGVFARFFGDANRIARFLRGEDSSPYLIMNDTPEGTIRRLMADIISAFDASQMKESFEIDALVLLLLTKLCTITSYSYSGINQKTMQMLDYIAVNYQDVTVGSLAAEFGYSENYLTQYFRKHTGKTLSSVIASTRLAKAAQLMEDPNLTLEAIANDVGYASYSHFFQVFRRHFGMGPKEWREEHLGARESQA
ncbi:MAG: AraC family transcriptional regulator [Atopobiaceae bacterium]